MNQGAVIVAATPTFSPWGRMIPKPSPGSSPDEMRVNVVNLGVPVMALIKSSTLEAFLESHPALDVRDIIVFVSQNDFIDVQRRPLLVCCKLCFRVIDGWLDRGQLPAGPVRPPHGYLVPLLAGELQDRRTQESWPSRPSRGYRCRRRLPGRVCARPPRGGVLVFMC